MKKIITTAVLVFFFQSGKADTITNWQLTLDSMLMYAGNEVATPGTFTVDTRYNHDSVSLHIFYRTCAVFARRRKIDLVDNTGTIVLSAVDGLKESEVISIKIKSLKRLAGKGQLKVLYDETGTGSTIFYGYPKLLCYIKIE
ncbi:MAG: hypothetical protein EXR21_06760 [Flavobacteriaceae bacterium]|nr:hypothetical protein [Flavobacteriaceae bacterium]